MNYIKRLEAENRELRARLSAAKSTLQDVRTYFAMPKFNWPDDYARTHEFMAWFDHIDADLHGTNEESEVVNG